MTGRPPSPEPLDLDPQLPFLAALERSLAHDADRIYREHASAARARTGRRGLRPAVTAGRVSRRAATLTGLLITVAASAWGASTIVGNHGGAVRSELTTEPLTVATGAAGPEHWSLQVWRSHGALCTELLVANEEQSACGPTPHANQLTALTVTSPTRRYVFGLAPADIAAVDVDASGTAVVRTHAMPAVSQSAPATRARWFLTSVGRSPERSQAPVRVTPAADSPHARIPRA
jgi:hypothetical protein